MIKALLLLIGLQLSAAHATEAEGATKPYLGPVRDGFFWYRDPRPTPTPSPSPTPSPTPVPAAPVTQPVAPTPEPPPPFSSEWIRLNMPKYLDKAIDEPTEENVAAYFALQRVTLDKSERFAQVAQRVVVGQAMLDESFRRPLNSFGANNQSAAAEQERLRLFSTLKERVGIFYFYRSDCGYCIQQGPIMDVLRKEFGFTVTAISMDGQPPPSGSFDRFLVDEGQSAVLGVQATPAIFLVKPDTRAIAPISQGLLSVGDFMDRALLASHKQGWITDAEFQATRPVDRFGPQIESPQYWDAITQLMGLPSDASTPLNRSPPSITPLNTAAQGATP